MVSMNFEGLVTNVDTSGSIMRYDLPQGLYGLPAEGNNMGVLFGPSESLPTNCSYPVDASTGFRIGEDTPDNSRCGRGVLGNVVRFYLTAGSAQLVKRLINMQMRTTFNQGFLCGDLT